MHFSGGGKSPSVTERLCSSDVLFKKKKKNAKPHLNCYSLMSHPPPSASAGVCLSQTRLGDRKEIGDKEFLRIPKTNDK